MFGINQLLVLKRGYLSSQLLNAALGECVHNENIRFPAFRFRCGRIGSLTSKVNKSN